MPNGQFGTRLQGGKDSASERYIFTQLSKITRCIFPEADDQILDYLNDDGQIVEPRFYAGIIPMIAVNGSKGIGTGFSTDVPCFNPSQLIHYLKQKLIKPTKSTAETETSLTSVFIPYYEGFKGTIQQITDTKFLVKGKYEIVGPDKIRITELPVGLWTDDFKEYLETLTETTDKDGKKTVPIVKDYDDMCKDTTIDIIISMVKGKVAELEAIQLDNGTNGLEKQFKLVTSISTNNMHLFDANDKLKKYNNITEIIDDYFITRLNMYETRKTAQIQSLEKGLIILSNKCRYIKEILDNSIDLRRKKREEVYTILSSKKYNVIEDDHEYKYLVKLPMDSVTDENVAKMTKEYDVTVKEIEDIKSKTIENMWLEELTRLENEYDKYREERERSSSSIVKEKGKSVIKTSSKISKK